MNNATLHIIKLWTWLGLSSLLYFCLLTLHIPIPVMITLSITLGVLLFYKRQISTDKTQPLVIIIAILGAYLLISESLTLAEKHGLWDAWAIWNLHAKYLSNPENWELMFLNSNGAHPDYPLALPGILAYFQYLLPANTYWVAAYGIHLLITLSIPLLIYLETHRKNLIIAAVAMLLFCTNTHFIYIGVSQLADTLLSLFFLITLISLNNVGNHPKSILFAALFTGLCMWTKNEGIAYAVFILLFHFNEFFNVKNRKISIVTLSLITFIVLIFKLLYATSNDLLSSERQSIWELITDPVRYQLIYDSFSNNLNLHFRSAQYAFILFVLFALLKRGRVRLKQLIMILFICLVLMSVYLVTPHNLEWHLFTSQSRLMLQLLPAFIYVLAINFSEHATVKMPKAAP